MGAEFYAHFGVDAGQLAVRGPEELRDDAGGVKETVRQRRQRSSWRGSARRARRPAASRPSCGSTRTKLHFFDADSGESLTFKQ